jgi:hypothetical protein
MMRCSKSHEDIEFAVPNFESDVMKVGKRRSHKLHVLPSLSGTLSQVTEVPERVQQNSKTDDGKARERERWAADESGTRHARNFGKCHG